MVRPFCLWNNVNNAHSVKAIPALQEQRMKYNCHLNLTDNGIILNAFSKTFISNLSVDFSTGILIPVDGRRIIMELKKKISKK